MAAFITILNECRTIFYRGRPPPPRRRRGGDDDNDDRRDAARAAAARRGGPKFYDLGSGAGRAVFTAALVLAPCASRGIEAPRHTAR